MFVANRAWRAQDLAGRIAVVLALALAVVGAGKLRAEVALSADDGAPGLEDNLRAHLALAEEPCDAPDWRVRRLFDRVEDDLRPGLRALGHYAPRIEKTLNFADDCWQATISVQPGPRVEIRERRVDISGEAAGDQAFDRLLARLPQAPGQPLNHGEYESIKSSLRALAARRGYLDFAFTRQELRVYPERQAADIVLEADSGERYELGEIRFGPHPLSPDLVRRLARVEAGDDYESGRLIDIDRNLSDSGYFRRVEVRPVREEAEDGQVPVDIWLDAEPRHAWRAGVGYSTDTSWRGSLGYENRYVNESGHQFDAELRVGPVESGLKADYLVPGEDPHEENYSFGARLLHEENDGKTSDSVTLIGRHVLQTGDWTQTRFVELLHERSEVSGETQRDTLLMPGIAFDRLYSDDLLRPERGYRVNLELRGAHDALLSTATLLQFRARVKGVYRFGDQGRVIGRARLGMTVGDEVENMPLSLRFFAGGDNSVRGYAYKSLGPTDAAGEVIGGRQLLSGSIEYEHPVYGEDWWLGAFVDAGNAFDDFGDDYDIKVGYGLGVRWYSPIGRIRLDVGFPEDDPGDDWQIHFALGTEL
jgi:translocation and assembly module TamA